MNSNPYALPGFIACVAVLFGCGAWAFVSVTKPAGRHARRRDPGAEAGRFGAELRGEPEPPAGHPGLYDPDETGEPDEPGWWEQLPPEAASPAGPEVLDELAAELPAAFVAAVPSLAARQPDSPARRATTDPAALAKVRDALMPDAWRTPPGEVTFTPASPDATCTDLPAVQDAPQYLAAPQ